jgi:hypothetical protein
MSVTRRLLELAEQLGSDEQAVLLLIAERMTRGRQQYGTLHVAIDRRCFPQEALEEAADGLVYAAVALMRGRDGGTAP